MKSYIIDALLLYSKKYVSVPQKDFLLEHNPYKVYTKLSATSSEILKLNNKWGLSRKESLKLVRLLVECAVEKIKEMGIDLSLRTIVDRMLSPDILLDDSLPGWTKSKLFRSLLK